MKNKQTLRSGKDLVSMLDKVGYPVKLQAENFDWIFEDEETYAFLEYICDHISWRNLSASELDPSIVESREELEKLEEEYQMLQTKLKKKKLQAECMNQTMNGLIFNNQKTEKRIKKVEQSLSSDISIPLKSNNESFNTIIKKLEQSVSHLLQILTGIHQEKLKEETEEDLASNGLNVENMDMSDSQGKTIHHENIISNSHSNSSSNGNGNSNRDENNEKCENVFGYNKYGMADDLFLQKLKSYLDKQSEVQDQMKKLSRKSSYNFSGLNQAEYNEFVNEIERLKSAYMLGEQQLIEANIELERSRTVLEKLKMHNIWRDSYTKLSLDAISSKIEFTNSQLQEHKTYLSKLKEDVERLISEVADLSIGSVLSGDYDLKIAREEHEMQKQEKFMLHLEHQGKRHKLLMESMKLEEKRLMEGYQLMKSLQSDLSSVNRQVQDRMIEYKRVRESTKQQDENNPVISNNDEFVLRMYDILEGENNSNNNNKNNISNNNNDTNKSIAIGEGDSSKETKSSDQDEIEEKQCRTIYAQDLSAMSERVALHIIANDEQRKRFKQQQEFHFFEVQKNQEAMENILFSSNHENQAESSQINGISLPRRLIPQKVQQVIGKLEQETSNSSDLAKSIIETASSLSSK